MATRVLSIPGRRHGNRYFALIADALERRGCTIVEPIPSRLLRFDFDVLHLNFPTHYISENGALRAWFYSSLFAAYLLLVRLARRKIIYTVHDVVPFRSRNARLSKRFLQLTHGVTDVFVFLSRSSRAAFVELYPEDEAKPWVLAEHGPYPTTPLSQAERAARRQEIVGDGDGFLVGFLGSIKPYKNLAAVQSLPHSLRDGRPVRVLVAGKAEAGTDREVAAMLATLPPGRAIRLDVPLSDAALDGLIQCVDVVLLPYLKGTNSGVALLVLSNGSRVIGSDLPIFRELARTVGAPWVYSLDSGGAGKIGDALEAVADRGVAQADRDGLRAYLDRVSFGAAAEVIADMCEALVNRRRINMCEDSPSSGSAMPPL